MIRVFQIHDGSHDQCHVRQGMTDIRLVYHRNTGKCLFQSLFIRHAGITGLKQNSAHQHRICMFKPAGVFHLKQGAVEYFRAEREVVKEPDDAVILILFNELLCSVIRCSDQILQNVNIELFDGGAYGIWIF